MWLIIGYVKVNKFGPNFCRRRKSSLNRKSDTTQFGSVKDYVLGRRIRALDICGSPCVVPLAKRGKSQGRIQKNWHVRSIWKTEANRGYEVVENQSRQSEIKLQG